MEFDLKKDWMKWLVILLAVTTAFNLGNDLVSHAWQMYALSGLVIYHFLMQQ